MSLRWRNNGSGDILCAARSDECPSDIYIDDALHYQLAVAYKVFIPDENERENGIWYISDMIKKG